MYLSSHKQHQIPSIQNNTTTLFDEYAYFPPQEEEENEKTLDVFRKFNNTTYNKKIANSENVMNQSRFIFDMEPVNFRKLQAWHGYTTLALNRHAKAIHNAPDILK